VPADKTVGADRVLRFLALVDSLSEPEAQAQLAKRRRSAAPPAAVRVETGAQPALRGPL
jgi:hypothetical protein